MEHTSAQYHGRWFHADGRLDGAVWRPVFAVFHARADKPDGISFLGGDAVIGDETFMTRELARKTAVLQAMVAIDGGA